jgi:hypothetical protein
MEWFLASQKKILVVIDYLFLKKKKLLFYEITAIFWFVRSIWR